MLQYYIVEKNNAYAVHAICSSLDSAERWIRENAVYLLSINAFTNKSLNKDSFCIQVRKNGKAF